MNDSIFFYLNLLLNSYVCYFMLNKQNRLIYENHSLGFYYVTSLNLRCVIKFLILLKSETKYILYINYEFSLQSISKEKISLIYKLN